MRTGKLSVTLKGDVKSVVNELKGYTGLGMSLERYVQVKLMEAIEMKQLDEYRNRRFENQRRDVR